MAVDQQRARRERHANAPDRKRQPSAKAQALATRILAINIERVAAKQILRELAFGDYAEHWAEVLGRRRADLDDAGLKDEPVTLPDEWTAADRDHWRAIEKARLFLVRHPGD